MGLDEQSALEPLACEHLPQPLDATPCNHHMPCPATWAVGNWSQVSAGWEGLPPVPPLVSGYSEADSLPPALTACTGVLCTNDTGVPCDEAQQPAHQVICSLPPCLWPLDTLVPEGSGSGSSSHELFNKADFIPHHLAPCPSPNSAPRPASMGNAIDE
ncbi:A disintegrin and metalloproteinase with thrombospondin motifs 7 [Saguinus oedipus]|uniref:A disintegrin and metalloproteinase with thrombospondin motifs 7 n=1 Tax=Saguinus oedipus TaxID=9490 RepID=A0ABQ9TU31_SAGOE|nr:A disintegrin and metalloproteinase with thrombospondin motifs 7 [Saguinus oedipus]